MLCLQSKGLVEVATVWAVVQYNELRIDLEFQAVPMPSYGSAWAFE